MTSASRPACFDRDLGRPPSTSPSMTTPTGGRWRGRLGRRARGWRQEAAGQAMDGDEPAEVAQRLDDAGIVEIAAGALAGRWGR